MCVLRVRDACICQPWGHSPSTVLRRLPGSDVAPCRMELQVGQSCHSSAAKRSRAAAASRRQSASPPRSSSAARHLRAKSGGLPDGCIMCLSVPSRRGVGQRAERMIRPRCCAHGEKKPTALQVRQQRQMLQEPALLRHALLCPLAHEVWVSDGSAQDNDSSFGRRLVASPDCFAQL